MPETKPINVSSLQLDLKNFRTTPQSDEAHAINAMIAISPDRFWALMESILDNGYEPTENIIVLNTGGRFVVKEGNRRIGALKLIFGLIKDVDIPDNAAARIRTLLPEWKKENRAVPCVVYPSSSTDLVDKLVDRTHAKGEKAGRDQWNAVARARHARDRKGKPEPGLDLLENYLLVGRNLSSQQAERWTGDYPLTVLDEAIQKMAPHLGCSSAAHLAQQYPKKHKRVLDHVLLDIGSTHLGFKQLRDRRNSWLPPYGISADPSTPNPTNHAAPAQAASNQNSPAESSTGSAASRTPVDIESTSEKQASRASNDPRAVHTKLVSFQVNGSGREKVVTLLDEIKQLNIEHHPHAFCFLLRSIFELSAKAYCADHEASGGPRAQGQGGRDKPLADVLRECTKHLTGNGSDQAKVKLLHGAMTELGKSDGILSVTSFNQLVHNPSFSIAAGDICIMFGNIFPLLSALNS